MTKKNLIKERLANWLETLDVFGSNPPSDFAKKAYGGLAARTTGELSKAATYFSLDPNKPTDAAILLRILASVVFGAREAKRPTGSTKWDEGRLFRLLVHRMRLEREIPGISDAKAAAEIKKRHPQYKYIGIKSLRQCLSAARREGAKWLDAGILEILEARKQEREGQPDLERSTRPAEALKLLELATKDLGQHGLNEQDVPEILKLLTTALTIEQEETEQGESAKTILTALARPSASELA